MKTHVSGWAEFQHYRDRSPPWIKLHRKLLDSMDYNRLSPIAAKCLPLLWLIASEDNGQLPDVPRLAFRLRIDEAATAGVLSELTAGGFLGSGAAPAEQAATPAQAVGWGSRHIPDKVKREVWARDGGKCCACGSSAHVEYDHIIPVSLGGTSETSNLQLLCRTCNRKKRTRVATHAQPLRSLEGEGETEDQNQNQERVSPAAPPTPKTAKEANGSRLPADWKLPDDWRAWAKAKRPDVSADEEADKFADFWHAKAGKDGRKADWLGTWRNWIRRADAPRSWVAVTAPRSHAGNSPVVTDTPASRIRDARIFYGREVTEGRISPETARAEIAKVEAKYGSST